MPDEDSIKMSLVELPHVTLNALAVVPLVVALLAVIVGLFFFRSRASAKKNSILLVGSSDAGKTAILSTLCYGQTLPSQTSVQINSAALADPSNSKKVLTVIDVPGHPRLRGLFKDHVADAKAIVFIVDTSTITRNGRDVAEHLHHILHEITSLPPSQKLPPLLILAHKADLIPIGSTSVPQDRPALAVSRVRTVLERELEKRRAASASGVGIEKLGAEDEGTELGGLECGGAGGGNSFRFVDWEGGEVSFVGSWVKVGEPGEDEGLDALRSWLAEFS